MVFNIFVENFSEQNDFAVPGSQKNGGGKKFPRWQQHVMHAPR